jgi:MoxR-like ATPase
MALHKASKSMALVRDRSYCLPDDIKDLASVVLSHRVMVNGTQAFHGRRFEEAERVIQDIVEAVPVPL